MLDLAIVSPVFFAPLVQNFGGGSWVLDLVTLVDTTLATYVLSVWRYLTIELATALRLLLAIYIALQGFDYFTFKHEGNGAQIFMSRVATIVLVYGLFLSASFLNTVVFDFVTNGPAAIGDIIVRGSGVVASASIFGALQNLANSLIDISSGFLSVGGLKGISASLIALVVLVIGLGFIAYGMGLVVLSKVATSVLLSLFPVFIVLYLFSGTRGLFEGWLRQMLTFALVPLFAFALIGLSLVLIDQAFLPISAFMTASPNDVVPLDLLIGPLLVVVICWMLLAQVVSWSSGVAGGLSVKASAMPGAERGGFLARSAARGGEVLRDRVSPVVAGLRASRGG